MTVKAKIGVLVMALLEDDYNRTGHMRPAATAAARDIADRLARFGDVVHAGLVEEESHAAAAARLFNAEDVDIIVAMELAYTKGIVPARCLIDTTAPVLVWNAQKIARLGEDDGFDVVMLNSGMAGMPELTAVLTRTGRDYTMITSRLDDPEGLRRVEATIKAAAIRRRLRTARVALVGHPFEGMTDLMFDGLSLRQDVGPVVWPLEPEKIAVRFGEIPQAEVDATVAGERAKYTVEMEPALFERSVRMALALESVVKEHGFDAFTAFDQVWLTDPRVGRHPPRQRPGRYPQRRLADRRCRRAAHQHRGRRQPDTRLPDHARAGSPPGRGLQPRGRRDGARPCQAIPGASDPEIRATLRGGGS